jgi:hypothetical protein
MVRTLWRVKLYPNHFPSERRLVSVGEATGLDREAQWNGLRPGAGWQARGRADAGGQTGSTEAQHEMVLRENCSFAKNASTHNSFVPLPLRTSYLSLTRPKTTTTTVGVSQERTPH